MLSGGKRITAEDRASIKARLRRQGHHRHARLLSRNAVATYSRLRKAIQRYFAGAANSPMIRSPMPSPPRGEALF